MRLGHATDPHLDWTAPDARALFVAEIRAANLDLLIVTGDVAERGAVADHLRRLSKEAETRIAFVLGNHDFYGGSIAETRARVVSETADSDDIVYLPAADPVPVGDAVLVGVDGWADGRLGNRFGSPVRLRDWCEIRDLAAWGRERPLGVAIERNVPGAREELLARLGRLGTAEAVSLLSAVERAREVSNHVVVATHVPPWWDAAWYDGRRSTANWVPWFACHAVGRAIEAVAAEGLRFTVLCGHTHGGGRAAINERIECRTGRRPRERPCLDSVLVV